MKIIQILLFLCLSLSAYGQWPEGFYSEIVDHTLNNPVGIVFDELGQGYVYSKDGKIFLMDLNSKIQDSPLLDISDEVAAYTDHGLTSVILGPNFIIDGRIYLFYAVDRHHMLYFGTDDYDPLKNEYDAASIGRITSYQLDPVTGFKSLVPNSRKVILGKTIADGIPILMTSHGMGALAFGEDGSLLASAGDAGSFQSTDQGSAPETWYLQAIEDGIIDEKMNIGSWRAQNIDSPNGKILRIDPFTGEGLSSNPWFQVDDPDSWRSKIYTIGMRNPFRFFVLPETGSLNIEAGQPGVLIVGDVGSWQYEEFNFVHGPGENLGWPKYEGQGISWSFNPHDTANTSSPNPLYLQDDCQQEFFSYKESLKQPLQFGGEEFPNQCKPTDQIPSGQRHVHTRPAFNYANINWNSPPRTIVSAWSDSGEDIAVNILDDKSEIEGFTMAGFSCIPSFIYQGEKFPEQYKDKIFFSDFYGFINSVEFDQEDGRYFATAIDSFSYSTPDIVTLSINPVTEDMYYTRVWQDTIVRIIFGLDQAPKARINASPSFGASPLTVNLDAGLSSHPLGYPLGYEWLIPNIGLVANESFEVIIEAVSAQPENVEVRLVVTDSTGLTDTAFQTIYLNNTPPTVTITSPMDGDIYDSDQTITMKLIADINDAETDVNDLKVEWQLFLQHNTHFHETPIVEALSPQIAVPFTPCNLESFWYRIKVIVEDPQGLISQDEIIINPDCEILEDRSMQISIGAISESIQLPYELSNSSSELEFLEIWRSPSIGFFEYYERIETPEDFKGIYTDEKPLLGGSQYYIKGVTKDQSHIVSNTVFIEDLTNFTNLIIFPNPNEGNFHIRLLATRADLLGFFVYDLRGRLLTEWTDEAIAGSIYNGQWNTSNLSSGMYILQVKNGDQFENFRWFQSTLK